MNTALKNLQKQTGIKQGQFDNEKNRLYNYCQTFILMLQNLIKQCEDANMTDEQFYIDFENKLNELSIKDHNANLE